MHILTTFCLFIFLSFSFKQENNDDFLWESEKKLTWQNFKRNPDISSSHAAATDCRIKFNYHSKNDTLFVSIKAVLVQSKSWVKSKSKVNALLYHEQIHFDIAEIYARKLRQSMMVLQTSKEKAIESLFFLDKLNDEHLEDFQRLYDSETNYGTLAKQQLNWGKKINDELKSLGAYQNTEIKILLIH